MSLRKSSLAPGWYPKNRDEITRFMSAAAGNGPGRGHGCRRTRAAIAPHAGWFYSGRIAAGAVSLLDEKTETLVVIGGHVPGGGKPLFAMEDAVETPLGDMPLDVELRAVLIEETGGGEDRFRDNTVEVLLPMARFFLPNASLLWMRLPADMSSFETGKTVAALAKKPGRNLAVLASADLTHYGRNFDFAPRGTGPEALRWTREVNDRRFIKAVESGNPADVLERAEIDRSSCSAGAVLAAMGFASAMGLGPARLLEYGTSADAENAVAPESFVGYAAFAF